MFLSCLNKKDVELEQGSIKRSEVRGKEFQKIEKKSSREEKKSSRGEKKKNSRGEKKKDSRGERAGR